MPEKVTRGVKANQIRTGDEVDYLGQKFTVLGTEIKQRYVYVTINDAGKKARVPIDETVTVERVELTENERAEQNRKIVLEHIGHEIDRVTRAVVAERQNLIEQLAKDPSWHVRHWEKYAELQITAALWARVVRVTERNDLDLIEATRRVRDDVLKRFVDEARFTNVSTSGSGNFASNVESQATANWLRELRWDKIV